MSADYFLYRRQLGVMGVAIAQSILEIMRGYYIHQLINPVYEVIWALAAAGFAAFLAFMERGAEKRSGADFRHYLMFSVLPVNIIALIVAAVRGAAEYKTWSSGTLIYVYNPLYPIGIAVGTIWITLAFIAINRLTRREA